MGLLGDYQTKYNCVDITYCFHFNHTNKWNQNRVAKFVHFLISIFLSDKMFFQLKF